MDEKQKRIILEQIDKKLREIDKNDKKIKELCIKTLFFKKNEFENFYKKIIKEVKTLEIEDVTLNIRIKYK